DAAAIQGLLASYGGQLAHTAGDLYVAVFDSDSGAHPVQRAVSACEALTARRLTERALVDLGQVSIQPRPGGGRRYMSALFTRAARLPIASAPSGVLLSEAAFHLVEHLAAVPAGRPGILRIAGSKADEQATIVKRGAGPLVGRNEVLDGLVANARAALESKAPSIATVIAEPGYGKSHLCLGLMEALGRDLPQARLIQLRAQESLGGQADQTLRELLTKVLGIAAESAGDEGRARLTERLGAQLAKEVWPGVALVFGWLSPDA